MTFQTPVTVETALARVHQRQYVLPAIQREFVWGTDQIRRLVDSLMRGYPIGSFLLWEVTAETAAEYTFYEFLTHFHERENPYAPKATLPHGQGVTAVLDGQQRLTALNIALYGSHAEKRKYAWWGKPDSFPTKRLHLDLLADADPEELGLRYNLRFLTDAEATPAEGEPRRWFRVGDVLGLKDASYAVMTTLKDRGIDLNETEAFRRLDDLHQAVRVTRPINYYLETDQDSDKVLDIFVRVNSGGTTLSYSDLLLSMATNQWQELDAREEVRKIVETLNAGGSQVFAFSKDVVLKTALMVAGVDLRFKVSNFTSANMATVEKAWPRTREALVRARTLLGDWGFSARTLSADSVIVPLAYYLATRQRGDAFRDSSAWAADRERLRGWVTRSLVKRGIWSSGSDATLTRLRQALDTDHNSEFPVDDIERQMARVGKSLVFDVTEIDELLLLKYGGQRTFTVLALLYPGLDFSKQFHEDHVFPRSRFTRKRLADAGVPATMIDEYVESVDTLPNLQLLAGTANTEKQATLPASWLRTAFATEDQRRHYIVENDLHDVPEDVTSFHEFMSARREHMRKRLMKVLGVQQSESAPAF